MDTDRPCGSDPIATAPALGWYGDDFTGATDTLAVLAQAGLRALLFLRVPSAAQRAAAGPLDAVGIAGAARAMAPDAMRRELAPVGAFFASLGVRLLHYKVCSTFDSAPEVGNVAVAVETLRPYVADAFVPIVGGQPNIGRYCVFGTLFAAAGTGGAVHRIDRHPTMSRHPVTPMHEADLGRHLGQQGLAVSGFHRPAYAEPADAQAARLDALLESAEGGAATRAVLFDVLDAADLAAVGRLIGRRTRLRPVLAVGASSVMQAMTVDWRPAAGATAPGPAPAPASTAPGPTPDPESPTPGPAPAPAPTAPGPMVSPAPTAGEPGVAPAVGPVFVLAGSLSPVTAAQVEAARTYDRLAVDALRLTVDPGYADERIADVTARLTAGRHVLVATTGADSPVDTARSTAVSHATAAFVAQVVTRMAAVAPLRRVGIAGGDTSTRVVQALGLWGLSYRSRPDPGVALCRAHSDDPALDGLELMLKGGQMGAVDLFDRLAAGR
jgi:uncharacterized protein YgbK (DUF1537 family)